MKPSTTRQAKTNKRFEVGSNVFFSGFADFKPNDTDYVEFEEDPKLYKNVMQFRKKGGTRCLFKWRLMSADEFVEYTLNSRLPMEIGKFLVPAVADFLGITIEHLKRMKPVIDRLDERHKYEQTIYRAYISHGGFWMTDEERSTAYEEYKRSRNGIYQEP